MHDDLHERLLALLRTLSVRRGNFTLASGKSSDLYVDVRQTALHAEGSWLIGRLLLARLRPEVVGVGGLTLGADPIACSAAALSTTTGRPVHAFLIRKEAKGHGIGSFLVGEANLPSGSPVCMVEDTTTTGGSLLQAIRRAEEAGLKIVQVVTVVDREEGAGAALAEAGFTLEALATRTQLIGPPEPIGW
jgi:orotate phosphoribosyltransferase